MIAFYHENEFLSTFINDNNQIFCDYLNNYDIFQEIKFENNNHQEIKKEIQQEKNQEILANISYVKNEKKENNPENEIKIQSNPKEKIILNFKISHNDLSNQKFFQGINQIFSDLVSKKNAELVQNLNGKEICFLKEIENLAGIVFEIDSFGGSAIDSLCLAEKINFVKDQLNVPVVSHIKTGYSAGYMLPSLCSDQIFVSKYGEIGGVGVYFKEQNFSKILEAIRLDTIVFASEGTAPSKYHDSSMQVTEELELSKIKDATRVLNQYLLDLNEQRPEIFEQTKKDSQDFASFRSGLNLSSFEAKKLGLVDQIGQVEDAKNYVKNLILANEKKDLEGKLGFLKTKIEPNLSFKIIDIKLEDFNKTLGGGGFGVYQQKNGFLGFDEFSGNNSELFSLIKSNDFLIQTAIQAYIQKIL